MKTILSLFIILFFCYLGSAKDLKAYQIYDKNGKKVDFDKLIKNTENKKFIFFGELHNNPISHWLEFELMQTLFTLHKKKLMLGGEMFESDNQYIINEYLNDQISTKNFQDEVRLWTNYNTDYKPLIEFAKERKLNFIATNIPRRYASMMYKQGIDSLKNLSEMAKSFIVSLNKFEFDSTVNCYRKMITELGDHGGLNIAKAQAIKDATMAQFILMNKTNKTVFLHFNGAYHSDNKEGIIHYLKKEIKEKYIMNITTVTQAHTDKLEKHNIGLADFIICVPETMTTTH